MLVSQAMHVLLTAVMLWEGSEAATSSAVKLCGRHLSEIMSRVCHAYNSPSWDVPTVIEQPGAVTRRKRQLGIADECCVIGCTWEQLSEYCSISAYSESPLEDLQEHIIADRSAEVGASGSEATSQAAAVSGETRRSGRLRTRGYGRARRPRCRCRRKRRSGRRRTSPMEAPEPRNKCSRCARSGHRITAHNMGTNSQH